MKYLKASSIVAALPLVVLPMLVFCGDEDSINNHVFFDLEPAGYKAFLHEQADWQFSSTVKLPVSVEDCWEIITHPDALQFWHPEVSVVEGAVGDDSIRVIDFSDFILDIVALGVVTQEETYDVWDDEGDLRRYSFFLSGSTRPTWFAWEAGREEFICEKLDKHQSRFTRNVALQPGIFAKNVDFIVRRRLSTIFEELCPQRLLQSIEQGLLPL